MKGYVKNIEEITGKNEDFRQVLYTAKNRQLVIMELKPKEEIGLELKKIDQFYRAEEGAGEAILDGVHTKISGALPCSYRQVRNTTSSTLAVSQ